MALDAATLALTAAELKATPVSYTHLDVYKRQAHPDRTALSDLRHGGDLGSGSVQDPEPVSYTHLAGRLKPRQNAALAAEPFWLGRAQPPAGWRGGICGRKADVYKRQGLFQTHAFIIIGL